MVAAFRSLVIAVGAGATAACAGWDNPTALSELSPAVEFEISADPVETLEEVEVHVHLRPDGGSMRMREGRLEIQHADGGPVRTVELASTGGGYTAHVTFFEEGEHHIHLMARLERHRLMMEMGEHEVHVHRQHRVIGPYWVELEVSPAPVLEDSTGHIHLFTYEILPDGGRGPVVGGLDVAAAVHAPDGDKTALTFVEEAAGEHEATFVFGHAGPYELHVEIHLGAEHAEGEFHIPVFTESGDAGGDGTGGGHGHA